MPGAVAVALSTHGGVPRAAGIVFASSVAGMFGVSSAFHRGSWTPAAARLLGRLDHVMIYGLIAGTYTPVGLLVLQPDWRLPILGIVWGGTFLAAALKLLWHNPPAWVTPAIGIALGWVAVIALPQIMGAVGVTGTLLLLAGGVAYSIGAAVYVRQRPDPAPTVFGYHEVFHTLVVLAVACQYSTIVLYVLPRG